MMNWSIREIHLPLKFDWGLSRGTSKEKTNLVVEVGSQEFKGHGEVAPNLRYGETPELAKEQFQKFLDQVEAKVGEGRDLYMLEDIVPILDACEVFPSLRFGIESAFLNYLSKVCEKSPWELLGTRQVNSLYTSFSIPVIPIETMANFFEKFSLDRFSMIKIKLGHDDSYLRVKTIRDLYKGKLCVDANEAWSNASDVLEFADKVQKYELAFIEQPMPAACYNQYAELKKHSPILIFADESLTTQDVTEDFAAHFDGVNVKLMKAGSFFKAMRQLREARRLGLYTMVGCMIETSLGISQAFNIADKVDFFDLDGHLIISKDPFGHLSEEKGRLFLSGLH